MRRSPRPVRRSLVLGLALAGLATSAAAQIVTLPPSGDNQRTTVIQQVGLARITVEYSSPDVHAPDGSDRAGAIWGGLVPYGFVNLGFGTCGDVCPWRAGANENTVVELSHDMEVEGRPLAPGRYGLHMVPGEETWTVIFSHDATSWGSFFYDPAEDALRVEVTPRPGAYHEWLDYEVVDRGTDHATLALQWENLEVPIAFTVPGMNDLYAENLRRELRSTAGFSWLGWNSAANWALTNQTHPEDALAWAQQAVSNPFAGQESFATLSTLALAQRVNGLEAESAETLERAITHPTATVFGVHGLGRTLIGQGAPELALHVFERNHELRGDWVTEVGLARGHSAVGDYATALEHARAALEGAPEGPQRQNVESLIATLEKGEDVN